MGQLEAGYEELLGPVIGALFDRIPDSHNADGSTRPGTLGRKRRAEEG